MSYAPQDVISTYSGDGPGGSGLDSYMRGMSGARTSFYNGQRGDITDFLGRYSGAINAQEPLSHMQDRIGRELGIPALQQNANTLNTTAANIPFTYGSATRGFNVNANQLGRIVGTKSAEIAPALTTANNALSSAQSTMNMRMGYEQAQQDKYLKPYESEQTLMNDRLARESTGFTSEAEGKLSAYIEKMKGGITLSRGEQDNAERLAAAKLQYDAAVKVAEINNSFHSLSAGSIGVNNSGGRVASNLGWS